MIARKRGGHSVPDVFKSEAQAVAFIAKRVASGTTVQADETAGWDALHSRFEMKRINQDEAGEFFSRMRRAEIGHHHRHIAGQYLLRYARESS